MEKTAQFTCQKEAFALLIESSLKSIPFNMLLALLISTDLVYKQVPVALVAKWFISMALLSGIRWITSQFMIKTDIYNNKSTSSLVVFLLLTLCMGMAWGSCYFIFFSYIHGPDERSIILLVLGGMSAGAIASLSVYLPAYFLYVMPMFLPIIAYNFYLRQSDTIILATMISLFVLMLLVTARINSQLLKKSFRLTKEKINLINQLEETNEKLEKSIEEIKVMSITDSLTGLFNRRCFDTLLAKEFNRAKRNNYYFNLVLLDIDNFKYINDTFGHPYGDDFLVIVANSLIISMRRSSDTLFRLGGDEFAAILANQSLDEAILTCNHIQSQFKQVSIHTSVTLSIGLICVPPNHASELKEIISAADEILYESKKNGKNQIIAKRV